MAMVRRETQISSSASLTRSICQTWVLRPRCTGRAWPVTQPLRAERRWLALMSRPTALWPSGLAWWAPTEPSDSASTTLTPPCSSPNGCLVRWSTGTRPRTKSSPISMISMPRCRAAVPWLEALSRLRSKGFFQIGMGFSVRDRYDTTGHIKSRGSPGLRLARPQNWKSSRGAGGGGVEEKGGGWGRRESLPLVPCPGGSMQRRPFVTLASSAAAVLAAPGFMRNAWAQESGISGKTLGIGCSTAPSGHLAGFGHDIRLGMEAAVAYVNGRGGIFGRTLQLSLVDDAYVPQRTADNVKQMISQGNVFVLLSCFGTPNNQAILPLLEEAGIPYVGPITGASSLRKSSRNVFHVRASYTDEIRRLVQRLAGMGLTGVGVVFLDNGFGRELLEDATRAMAEQQIKPLPQVALAIDGKNLGEVLAKVS